MILTARTTTRLIATTLLLVLSACAPEETTAPVETTGPAPAIAISLPVNTVTVAAGNSREVLVNLSRENGFSGDAVAVTVEGLPTGVTAATLSIYAGMTGGWLTLTAATTTAAATTALTVRATAPGVTSVTAPLSLVVQPQPGAITLSLSPTALTLPVGQQGSTTVRIERSGSFTGAVALSASRLPNGVTATFNPASVTGATSTLTISTSGTATAGTASISVNGIGTGVANHSVGLPLVVQALPANVSVTFCPSIGAPIWVAFQDGNGGWVRATESSGVYSGAVTLGRGGIAYVTTRSGGGFDTTVRYGTLAELQEFSAVYCLGASGPGKTVNVALAGALASDVVRVGLGASTSLSAAGAVPPLENVADGVLDLIASRAAAGVVNKLFAQRGVTPDAGSTATVDFGGANAVDPVTAALTLGNLDFDQAFVSYIYRTANRTHVVYHADDLSPLTARTIVGFPQLAGSFHQARVIAQGSDRIRSVDVVFATVAPQTLTLGPEIGLIPVTRAATTPTLRPQVSMPAEGPYDDAWSFGMTQGTGAQLRSATVQSTTDYVIGFPGRVTLVVPDLSGVPGYVLDWGLKANVATSWSAVGWSTTGFGPQGAFAEGARTTLAGRSGTLGALP
jgi:hypothetical protein